MTVPLLASLVLVSACAGHAAHTFPRVALLFVTKGPMPLESVWRMMLEEVADFKVPQLSSEDWDNVLDEGRVQQVHEKVLAAGQHTASHRLQDAACVSNGMIRVRHTHQCVSQMQGVIYICSMQVTRLLECQSMAHRTTSSSSKSHCMLKYAPTSTLKTAPQQSHTRCSSLVQLDAISAVLLQATAAELAASWTKRPAPLPTRGAALRTPSAAPHPVYAAQPFFSIYVHTPPSFDGFVASSIFHGREIVPQLPAQRFTHSLGTVSLLLLEAALLDTAVRNAKFVVLSESDVPVYNGGALYLQLLNEKRSRVGPTRSFTELLRRDQVRLCCMSCPFPYWRWQCACFADAVQAEEAPHSWPSGANAAPAAT